MRRLLVPALLLLLPLACNVPAEEAASGAGPDVVAGLDADVGAPYVPDSGVPDALPPEVDSAPFTPPASCDEGTVRILRVAPWPGGGVQLTVELTTPEGEPATEGADVAAVVKDADGGEHAAVVHKAWQGGGLTGVVLVPSEDAGVHAMRLQAARAFVEGLPEGERIALWVAAVPVRLAAELTDQREHVLARLDAVAPESGAHPGAPQIVGLRELMAEVEGPYGAVSRHLVIVDADEGLPDAGVVTPVQTRWLTPDGPDGQDAGGPAAAGAALAEDIVARRYGVVRIGACPGAAEDAPMTVELDGTPCAFTAPAPMPHMAALPCDPAKAAADDYPYPETVELVFTDAERAVWQARRGADSKEDFRASVRLGVSDPIPATLHLRGHTSLSCDRANYNVNLDGGEARRLGPGSATDELYLISMCKDEGYFNQTFAGALLQTMGLYPLEFRYVRMLEEGAERGAYILVEEPADALLQDHVDLAAIIRRRFDPEDQAEDVKYATGSDAKALALYEQAVTIAQTAPADEVADQMSSIMDLDAYLRWMAFMTFMVNGDYVDEVYFYGALEGAAPYFRMANWDPDDLFSACHHGSKFAHEDPAGILYCSEGKIDEAILRSPEVYGLFVDALEQVMADLTPAKLQWAMSGMREQLFAVVASDATAAAMAELIGSHPEAATKDGFRATVSAMMDDMLTAAEKSRADLTAKIAAWRAR